MVNPHLTDVLTQPELDEYLQWCDSREPHELDDVDDLAIRDYYDAELEGRL